MIRFKKLLILWLLSCFIFLWNSFVNAVACNQVSEIYVWYIHSIWWTFTSAFDSSLNVWVLSKWTFLSQTLGYWRKIFSPTSSRLFWRNSDWLPYLYFDDWYQWVPYYYHICDEITDSTTAWNLNCSTQVYDTWGREIVANFMSKVDNNDNWGYHMYSNYAYRTFTVCISSHEVWKSVCFYWYTCSYNSTCPAWNCPLIDSKNYQWLTFTNLSDSDIWESPWVWGSSWWGDLSYWWIELWSSESAILYFESKYWWDESICYAWIDNLTAIYGDPVSFQEWQWLSVFQVFSGLYWNSDLDKVYVWLNSWLINYDQWYERSEPLYLSNYNSWSNQVDLYYTWFTFPFANNPVAIYFLVDNIYNRSEYKTQWSEVISYCNLKINNWTFEEIIDQSVKENININTELVNINKWLNPDWSRREFDNIWAFLTSWTDLAFSWNTTVKNTLKNFFEDMDQALSVIDINTSNRILPTWLVTAFLFIVLFKIFRKR